MPEGIDALVGDVDPQRWFDDIVTLASFNRYTYGAEIDLARDWLVQQFETLEGVDVTTPSFPVGDVTAYNVVATLPGTIRPDDWYIIGGHYDATSEDPYAAAPGAEDNASGCAGVLEMARILTHYPQEGTLIFICYSGEEQGLYGSDDHAGDLVAEGHADKVQVMLDMDMIGYTSDEDLDCLLETEPFAEYLLDLFADAAEQYTSLRILTSTFAFGSDHVPYLERGMPALLTIENDWYEYPDYHRTTDLPENIDLDMGGEILRMNVAAVAQLIGSDPGAIFWDGFESGDVSAW
jgi:Zn-dependent M28 family amino/carboxypeptidase